MSEKENISPNLPVHTYLDLSFINNDATPGGNKKPVNMTYEEIRNSPYLLSPGQYFMSVVRWQCDTPSLPVWIPEVRLNQPLPNPFETIYSFTMAFNVGAVTIEVQTFITWFPQNQNTPPPIPPTTQQDLSSDFYYCYNYQWWLKTLNTGLVSAFNNLNAAVIVAGGILPTTAYPFFRIDETTKRLSLIADITAYDQANLLNPIRIFCNAPCYGMLSEFSFYRYGYDNIINGKNFEFIIRSDIENNTQTFPVPANLVPPIPAYTGILVEADGSNISSINPVASIVFTTSFLPVLPANVSPPKVFASTSGFIQSGNNALTQNILTDFIVPFSPDNTYRPTSNYNYQGEYRLIDLYGSTPLNSIFIECFWKDKYGGLHTLLMESGGSAQIKILFRRADFNLTTARLA